MPKKIRTSYVDGPLCKDLMVLHTCLLFFSHLRLTAQYNQQLNCEIKSSSFKSRNFDFFFQKIEKELLLAKNIKVQRCYLIIVVLHLDLQPDDFLKHKKQVNRYTLWDVRIQPVAILWYKSSVIDDSISWTEWRDTLLTFLVQTDKDWRFPKM